MKKVIDGRRKIGGKNMIEEKEKKVEENDVDVDEIVNENVVKEGLADYRVDIREWIKNNNDELENIEERIEGLLKAFKHSSDFYDGLRRIDARTDMSRLFLELVTRFMGKYEKVDDSKYKEEVVAYIKDNTKELANIQVRVDNLIKAYDYADDFLYGLDRLELKTDMSREYIGLLQKFIERGLED